MANFGKLTPSVIRTLTLPFEKGNLMKSQRLLVNGWQWSCGPTCMDHKQILHLLTAALSQSHPKGSP